MPGRMGNATGGLRRGGRANLRRCRKMTALAKFSQRQTIPSHASERARNCRKFRGACELLRFHVVTKKQILVSQIKFPIRHDRMRPGVFVRATGLIETPVLLV